MIRSLRSCKFRADDLDGDCVKGLIDSKQRVLAMLHDCSHVVPTTTQIFNQLSALPDLDELKGRQTGADEWLACAIKALIETNAHAPDDGGLQSERYAATALDHAGNILKRQQGYHQHVDEASATLEQNRQKAAAANVVKGKKTRQAILAAYDNVIKEKGNVPHIHAEIARRVGVTRQRVVQVLEEKKV